MSVYKPFIDTVATGISNPYGLAAVAATGKHESGYSPKNAFGAWSDPSESGQAGTAGGILSWRAERLQRLQQFAADNGDDPNAPSPEIQGAFFLQEDPALVDRLNQAGSIEEAQGLMNGAWKFAGYDRPGGEAANRLATARSLLDGGEIQDGSGGSSTRELNMGAPSMAAAYPSNIGGLGGLGGMMVEEEPEQGGLAGFFNNPGVADTLRAIGISMMSSPSNNMFAGVAETLPLLEKQRMAQEALTLERQDKLNDQRAMQAALMQAGFSQEQAAAYASSPQAATVAAGAMGEERKLGLTAAAQARDRAFLGGGAMGVDPMSEEALPPAGEFGGGVPGRAPVAGRAASSASSAPTGGAVGSTISATEYGTGNKTVDGLMAERARISNWLMGAPSDDAFQRGKVRLDQIDKRIEQYAPTSGVKEYTFAMSQRQAEGLPPVRYEEWKAEQSRAGATNVTVGAEKAYDGKVGGGYGDLFLKTQDEGRSASGSIATLDIMERAASSDSFYSGLGADQVMTVKKAAAALGIDPGGVADMETFNAQAKNAVLANMGGSLGAGVSNADVGYVNATVPQLGNTPPGNTQLIQIGKKLAKRKQDVAAFAREYARANGGRIDAGYDEALAQWTEANPLFPEATSSQTQTPTAGRSTRGVGWSAN